MTNISRNRIMQQQTFTGLLLFIADNDLETLPSWPMHWVHSSSPSSKIPHDDYITVCLNNRLLKSILVISSLGGISLCKNYLQVLLREFISMRESRRPVTKLRARICLLLEKNTRLCPRVAFRFDTELTVLEIQMSIPIDVLWSSIF